MAEEKKKPAPETPATDFDFDKVETAAFARMLRELEEEEKKEKQQRKPKD